MEGELYPSSLLVTRITDWRRYRTSLPFFAFLASSGRLSEHDEPLRFGDVPGPLNHGLEAGLFELGFRLLRRHARDPRHLDVPGASGNPDGDGSARFEAVVGVESLTDDRAFRRAGIGNRGAGGATKSRLLELCRRFGKCEPDNPWHFRKCVGDHHADRLIRQEHAVPVA